MAVRYVANKRSVEEASIVRSLKHTLRKIYIYLQDESNRVKFDREDVTLVLKLIKNQTD